MNSKKKSAHSGHGMPTGDARALKITGWLTGIYFIVELAIGYWFDAFHTVSAVGGVLIAPVAGYFSTRPAFRYTTFGLIRSEIIGALFLFLFLMVLLEFKVRSNRYWLLQRHRFGEEPGMLPPLRCENTVRSSSRQREFWMNPCSGFRGGLRLDHCPGQIQ